MRLTEFTEQDFLELYNFMLPIWLETYGRILSAEHLDFLLTKYSFGFTSVFHSFRAQNPYPVQK